MFVFLFVCFNGGLAEARGWSLGVYRETASGSVRRLGWKAKNKNVGGLEEAETEGDQEEVKKGRGHVCAKKFIFREQYIWDWLLQETGTRCCGRGGNEGHCERMKNVGRNTGR